LFIAIAASPRDMQSRSVLLFSESSILAFEVSPFSFHSLFILLSSSHLYFLLFFGYTRLLLLQGVSNFSELQMVDSSVTELTIIQTQAAETLFTVLFI
jgi:hypothetical protein